MARDGAEEGVGAGREVGGDRGLAVRRSFPIRRFLRLRASIATLCSSADGFSKSIVTLPGLLLSRFRVEGEFGRRGRQLQRSRPGRLAAGFLPAPPSASPGPVPSRFGGRGLPPPFRSLRRPSSFSAARAFSSSLPLQDREGGRAADQRQEAERRRAARSVPGNVSKRRPTKLVTTAIAARMPPRCRRSSRRS